MSVTKGLCVIGRRDVMGLGSMTQDFVAGMEPERVFLVDVGKTGPTLPIMGNVIPRAALSSYLAVVDMIKGMKVVVGFETFYREGFAETARSLGVKSVLFPNWEWTPAGLNMAEVYVCLTGTDYKYYRSQAVRTEWPKSPFVDERKLTWPPRVFAHFAGNAAHNRDGTKEVLQAAKWLQGTDAVLWVRSNFDLGKFGVPLTGGVSPMATAPSRKELFDWIDCLVCPRRLPGHSLPINEALGAGIPVVCLDLPDFNQYPGVYCVPAELMSGKEKFGYYQADVYRADPAKLGQLLRNLALGEITQWTTSPIGSHLPTWTEFRQWWQDNI